VRPDDLRPAKIVPHRIGNRLQRRAEIFSAECVVVVGVMAVVPPAA
jgi:hypothetical protein